MPGIVYKCKCGAISTFGTKEVGELRRCDKCLSSFMVPFESSEGTNLAPDELLQNPDELFIRHTRAPLTENVPVEFGRSFPLAYQPSGASGDLGKLVIAGFPAVGAGLAAAAACVGGAFALKVLYDTFPLFLFPFVTLVLIAVSPGILGWVTGLIIAKSVQEAKCRYPAAAGVVVLLWACGAIAFATVVAQFSMPEGQSFLDDGLVSFVREMAACGMTLSLERVEDLAPAAIPSLAVYGILVGSALLGIWGAYAAASRKVLETPFCEHCERYMKKHTLWSISPVHALKAVAAFLQLDYKAIRQVPYCDFSKNRIDVDVWGCLCRSEYILELVGHATIPSPEVGETAPEKLEPVRIFSRKLTLDELNKVRESGVTA